MPTRTHTHNTNMPDIELSLNVTRTKNPVPTVTGRAHQSSVAFEVCRFAIMNGINEHGSFGKKNM